MLKNMLIDYELLANAVKYYKNLGYEQIECPWMVDRDIIDITLPKLKQVITTTDGRILIGSAEQGLIKMGLGGKLEIAKKYFSISPCFRTDKNDSTHSKTFIKLELFAAFIKDSRYIYVNNFNSMLYNAKEFFSNNGVECKITNTDIGLDLEAYKTNLEIGSYGYRTVGEYEFAYGTGLALPRFTLAQQQENL